MQKCTNQFSLFVDDIYIFDVNENVNCSITKLNTDLVSLSKWASQWQVTFNPGKTVYMIFTKEKDIDVQNQLIFFRRTIGRSSMS